MHHHFLPHGGGPGSGSGSGPRGEIGVIQGFTYRQAFDGIVLQQGHQQLFGTVRKIFEVLASVQQHISPGLRVNTEARAFEFGIGHWLLLVSSYYWLLFVIGYYWLLVIIGYWFYWLLLVVGYYLLLIIIGYWLLLVTGYYCLLVIGYW
jgi:hypothetical protein